MYFVYTAQATGSYSINLLCSSNWDYATVQIYNSAKVSVKGPEWSENGTINITQAMTAGDAYYIVVNMLYNDGTLDLTLSSPKTEAPEEGGTVVAGGTDYNDAIEIIPGTKYKVSCDKRGKKVYFKYTATETGAYHLLVTGHNNAMVTVQNGNKDSHQLLQASWSTSSIDKDIAEFTAGETYYFIVQISGGAAELDLTLTEPKSTEEV